MLQTMSSRCALWAAAVCLSGCGSDGADSGKTGTGSGDLGCGEPVLEVVEGLAVACESGACELEVVGLQPAVPDRGDNTWTVAVRDAAGEPIAVQSVRLAPFMPAHDHGTVPAFFEGSPGDDGWTLGPFDLFMPGRWEMRATITVDELTEEQAVVAFCVEG